MAAYYNEFDPNAAAWLRELIKRGLIADGEVDTRSIEDVAPDDLRHFTQCHFFAGIGGWSAALRLAGWRDDQHVWTGSCPCQPFSSAGKGGGFADERHLWPAFYHLIEQCRPAVVFGEQVASKDGLAWLDLVHADLEAARYAVGAADLCAAGVGAPHIRQRLYWVADAQHDGRDRPAWNAPQSGGDGSEDGLFDRSCHSVRGTFGRLAHSHQQGLEGRREHARGRADERTAGSRGVACVVADTAQERRASHAGANGRVLEGAHCVVPDGGSFWTPADWLPCRDGKWRPVEPGTFPLAHGLPARVGRLRGYGNAIVPQVAATFVEAYLDTTLA